MPVDAIRLELTKILAQEDARVLWDGRTGVVQVTDATETTMQLRILVSAANSGNAFDLRCLVRERLIAFITQHYPDALPKRRVDESMANQLTPRNSLA